MIWQRSSTLALAAFMSLLPLTARAQPLEPRASGLRPASVWALDDARTPPTFGDSAARLTLIWLSARSPEDPSSFVDLGPIMNVGTQDFTISHWYRTTFGRPQSLLGDILGNRVAPSNGNFIAVRLRSNGTLSVELDQDDGGSNYVAADSGQRTINDGAWHFLTYTRRGGLLALYLDGQLVARNSTASGEPTNLNSPVGLRLGRTLSYPNHATIPGGYADVRILYGRALDEREIRNLLVASRERYGVLLSR